MTYRRRVCRLIHIYVTRVQETTFWRNYFYRVTLTKQAVLSEPVPAEPEPAEEESPVTEVKKRHEKCGFHPLLTKHGQKKEEVLFDFGDSDEEGETEDTKEKQAEKKPGNL